MRKVRFALLAPLLLLAGWTTTAQQRPGRPTDPDHSDTRLPNGKKQSDEILREDYRKNLEDAAELQRLTDELKKELERGDAFVLSLSAIKKTEDIEKVAKRIRSRLKR